MRREDSFSYRRFAGWGLVLLLAAVGGPRSLTVVADDADESPSGETAAADEASSEEDQSNPYLAPEDATPEELAAFIEKKRTKTASIRRRPGFAEAIAEAAERLLATNPSEEVQTMAILARFEALHFVACGGDSAADERLMTLADELKDDPRETVAHEARFHLLERQAAEAAQSPPEAEQLIALVEELKTFLAGETLTDRHLRLASRTVGVVNLLEDKEVAGRHFDELSEMLSKSDDRKMARYGRSVGQAAAAEPTKLIGKPLEIAGTTVEGAPFDWAGYRGKVVLVDFWATWCGPCVAELPNVVENYGRFHDRGFEVVGISLDFERPALEAFLKEQEIPWVTLFDDGSPGWDHPMAAKYDVNAIPRPVLVDAEGKVVSVAARGAELDRLLEKMLGARQP